jgi:hypothetical protein
MSSKASSLPTVAGHTDAVVSLLMRNYMTEFRILANDGGMTV